MDSTLEVSWSIGDEDCTSHGKGAARSRSSSLNEDQTRLPSITPNGIRLGTPVAREAAKSFWSMDMLKTSLNRMAFYADCENHSEGSLVSEDSGFAPSERATPTTQLPLLTTSAPSSPISPRQALASNTGTPHISDPNTLQQPVLCAVGNSPLLLARKEKQKELLRMTSTRNSNSSGSLTSSSKTISPSLSHTLLPRRQHRRSVSAGHGCQRLSYLPVHRGLRQAHSDTSVSHIHHDPSIFLRLTKNLGSNFNTGFYE